MDAPKLLEIRDARKTFGGIQALKGASLEVRPGEVLGLVGENGAGKSTLMRILCGIIDADEGSGELRVDGTPVRFASPHDAQRHGIAMVPQELLLIGELTVTENLFLGREKTGPASLLKKQRMREEAAKVLEELGCARIGCDTRLASLPKADQQLVAIARRLIQGGRVFILDEPTAALSEKETQDLFRIIRERILARGAAVIYISHRLEEIFQICDRVAVLRDGALVATLDDLSGLDRRGLIAHMVGAELAEEYPKLTVDRGTELLRVEGLSYLTDQGGLVENISFTVHEGEVVGITGLVGVGKTELGRVLMGLGRRVAGKVYLRGKELELRSPREARLAGFGYVSEDRRGEGLVLGLQSLQNMTLSRLDKYSKAGFLMDFRKERAFGQDIVRRVSMKETYLDLPAQNLSGGNQQKVVIIRQLVNDADLIIFDEPTKGIDVNAKSEIARIVGELGMEKKAVLLLSSEPREVLGMGDIIFVLTASGLSGPFPRGGIDYEGLMAIELGVADSAREEGTR